uniref:Uncharacterized protein n=2 Tax=Tetraselmis sp. GSL018 TaxID=582737 RepID=A0A061S356_9CHLO
MQGGGGASLRVADPPHGAGPEQLPGHRVVLPGRGQVQRRAARGVLRVGVGAAGEQRLDGREVAPPGRDVQEGHARVVRVVHRGAGADELRHGHGIRPLRADGEPQREAPAAVRAVRPGPVVEQQQQKLEGPALGGQGQRRPPGLPAGPVGVGARGEEHRRRGGVPPGGREQQRGAAGLVHAVDRARPPGAQELDRRVVAAAGRQVHREVPRVVGPLRGGARRQQEPRRLRVPARGGRVQRRPPAAVARVGARRGLPGA